MTEQPKPTVYDERELKRKIKQWAYTLAEHKIFCHEYFSGRADTIISYSEMLKGDVGLGSIQMLDLCMQIEAEFPGRLEEVYEESKKHPNGMLVGLGQYIRHLRTVGG